MRRLDLRAEPIDFIKNYLGAKVRKVKCFAQIGHYNHRKFEPFALMDAHEPNGVLVAHCGDLGLNFRRPLRLDETKKPEQPLPLRVIEPSCQAQQAVHIGVSLLTARLGQQPVRVMRFREHRLETVRKRNLAGQAPPARESLQEDGNFALNFGRGRRFGGIRSPVACVFPLVRPGFSGAAPRNLRFLPEAQAPSRTGLWRPAGSWRVR